MAEFNLMTWDAHWESETQNLKQYIDTLNLKGAMIESIAFLGELFNLDEFTEQDSNVNGRWAMVNEPVIFTLVTSEKTTDFEILFNSICGISFDTIDPSTISKYTEETRSNFASTIFNPVIGLKIDEITVTSYTDSTKITNPETIRITFMESNLHLEFSNHSGSFTQIFLKDESGETVKL